MRAPKGIGLAGSSLSSSLLRGVKSNSNRMVEERIIVERSFGGKLDDGIGEKSLGERFD